MPKHHPVPVAPNYLPVGKNGLKPGNIPLTSVRTTRANYNSPKEQLQVAKNQTGGTITSSPLLLPFRGSSTNVSKRNNNFSSSCSFHQDYIKDKQETQKPIYQSSTQNNFSNSATTHSFTSKASGNRNAENVKKIVIQVQQTNPLISTTWVLPIGSVTFLSVGLIQEKVSMMPNGVFVQGNWNSVQVEWCSVTSTISQIVERPTTDNPRWVFNLRDSSTDLPLTVEFWDSPKHSRFIIEPGTMCTCYGKIISKANCLLLDCMWIKVPINEREMLEAQQNAIKAQKMILEEP